MILESVTFILMGTFVTISVTLIALPIGFGFGLIMALVRVYGGRYASRFAAIYSTVLRGVPPIVLLFVLYFVIAGSINLSPFLAGSLALGIISSAYHLEIFRGAVLSVGDGQMIAARSIGMTKLNAIRYIILPQALRQAIPPWSNEAAIVLKDSSLVYAIGVAEILRRAQYVGASSHQYLLAFLTAGAIYFLLTFVMNRVLDDVERRTRIPTTLAPGN
jgi:polar amino acid transport system permease protein